LFNGSVLNNWAEHSFSDNCISAPFYNKMDRLSLVHTKLQKKLLYSTVQFNIGHNGHVKTTFCYGLLLITKKEGAGRNHSHAALLLGYSWYSLWHNLGLALLAGECGELTEGGCPILLGLWMHSKPHRPQLSSTTLPNQCHIGGHWTE